jgi:potassium-transporting ATPase potassium-binding subunit
MTANGWLEIIVLYGMVFACAKPLGIYMARVFERQKTFADKIFRPVEKLIYRLTGIDETHEMRWTEYAASVLIFSLVSLLITYAIERLQYLLPLNPQHLAGVAPDLALNTAVSFTTNTNWQSYVPEATMSYLTQMAGLAYHNFLSGALGIACAMAFVRGISRKESKTLGNFWVDTTRASLWVLLPAAFILSIVLVSQGVIQNFRPYDEAKLLQPQVITTTGSDGKSMSQTVTTQVIAQGPTASQESIKMLGTNGGGFFNTNSAHPFENPTPFSNLLEIFALVIIPAALTVTLGRMVRSPAHGWAVFAAMSVLFFAGVTVAYHAESQPNPLLHSSAMHIDQRSTARQSGGNMEGKEVRFGIAGSALFATVTTDASCGAVNAMHDSFMPLGGLVPLVNMMLGEVVFGGVGAGLYGMLVFVILAVFIAGLMVGRTPEYLGKKIESFDVKMSMLYVLIFPLSILGFSAIALMMPNLGLSALSNAGPHGLTEILYAYTSTTANNGSAFMGLNANTHWYNFSLAAAMLIGRFLMIVPMLALAGNLGLKNIVPPSSGTFPVHTPLFTVLLIGVILIVGSLTFFPALSLGPLLEHLLLQAGKTF